MKMFVKHL